MSVESCLRGHIKDLTKEEVLASMGKHNITPEYPFLPELQDQLVRELMRKYNNVR